MTRKYRPSEIAVKIDQAADLLENTGWCTGALKTPSGHFCLAGSVYDVTGVQWLEDTRFGYIDVIHVTRIADQTLEVLDEAAHTEYDLDAVSWNDNQSDKRKVVRFMRRTARKLRDGKITRQGVRDPNRYDYLESDWKVTA